MTIPSIQNAFVHPQQPTNPLWPTDLPPQRPFQPLVTAFASENPLQSAAPFKRIPGGDALWQWAGSYPRPSVVSILNVHREVHWNLVLIHI